MMKSDVRNFSLLLINQTVFLMSHAIRSTSLTALFSSSCLLRDSQFNKLLYVIDVFQLSVTIRQENQAGC
jgi:hypothetical protein